MKIHFLTTVDAGHRRFLPGETAFMADRDAQHLIDVGAAESVKPAVLKPIRIRVIGAEFADDSVVRAETGEV